MIAVFKKLNTVTEQYEEQESNLVEIRYDSHLTFPKSNSYYSCCDTIIQIDYIHLNNFADLIVNAVYTLDREIMINYLFWANMAYTDPVQDVRPYNKTSLDNDIKDTHKIYELLRLIENGNELKGISFSFKKKNNIQPKTLSLTSNFITEDLISLLKKNFHREYIVPYSNSSLYRKEFVRWLIINELYAYLESQISTSKQKSQNAALDFIGDFLHHAQIPTAGGDVKLNYKTRSAIKNNITGIVKFGDYKTLSIQCETE